MSLHDRIKRLEHIYCDENLAFKDGFQIARHEAAWIAKAADELMAEMAELIDGYKMIMQEMGVKPNRTDVLLAKYNDWKEQNK